jgi:O-antigen/teichoic acid export membrane protein
VGAERGVDATSLGAFGTVTRGLRTRGTQWMVVGAVLAGLGAYLFQIIGTRSLGEVNYAPIGALWTIQYLIVSVVLYPVETYVTHRTLLRREVEEARDRSSVRLWGWIAAIAIVLTGVCWLLRDQLFQGSGDLALVVGLVTCTFGAFVIVRGRLAGNERFRAYGLVTATESLGRAVLSASVVLVAASTRAIAWTMPFGALGAAGLWLILRRQPREARGIGVTAAEPLRPVRFLALTMGANGILQLLLAGGPLVLTFLGASPAEVSILFVALTAARVPLFFLFSGLLSRLLPTFLRMAGSDEGRALRRTASGIAIGTFAAAILGGLAAAVVGSPVIGLLFGRAFAPPWWVAAGATTGVLLATGSMVLNQVLIAQGSPARSLSAWALALAAGGVGLAVIGDSPTARVVGAFVIAETVALLGLVVGASRPPARRNADAGPHVSESEG